MNSLAKFDDVSQLNWEILLNMLEKELAAQLSQVQCAEPLRSAVKYYVFPKGKRLRPLLSLLLCTDLQIDPSELIPVVCAIEYVHTASLIHDDLPSIDNDDFRRGRPTCHRAFSEATAILAGDYLLAFAFNILRAKTKSHEYLAWFIELLSEAFMRICEGQELDLAAKATSDLTKVHTLKTGALFSCSAAFAGIHCGVDAIYLAKLKALGLQIGVFFQIVDDFVDQYGSPEKRGRPMSSDSRNQKLTFFSRTSTQIGEDALERARKDCLIILEDLIDSSCAHSTKMESVRSFINLIGSRTEMI